MSGRRLYLLLALPMLAMTLGCAALPAGRGSDPAVLIIRNHSGQDIGTATVSAAVSSANAGRRHGSISDLKWVRCRRRDGGCQQHNNHHGDNEHSAGHLGTSFLPRFQESHGGIGPSGQMTDQLAICPLRFLPPYLITNELPIPVLRLPIAA